MSTIAALAPDADLVDVWLDEYPSLTARWFVQPAWLAGERLAAGHTTHVALEPGNGFRYLMLLSLHPDPTLPGHLLVALPEFNRCMLMDPEGMHVPSYVAQKVGDLGPQHCAVIAVFTTLLSSALRAH